MMDSAEPYIFFMNIMDCVEGLKKIVSLWRALTILLTM